MNNETSLQKQLQILLLQLRSVPEYPLEDDTLLQKLYSTLDGLLVYKDFSFVWFNEAGLISFIKESLDHLYVKEEKNFSIVNFSILSLSSLVKNEDLFPYLVNHEVMCNFKTFLHNVEENMSFIFNSLKVAENLIGHNQGLHWFVENGIWENLLIRSLKLQNLFIRKSCTNVITKVILLMKDTDKFNSYIQDLELILHKVRERKLQFYEFCDEDYTSDDHGISSSVTKLQYNTQTILFVFHSLLLEALGKVSLHSQMKPIFDLSSKILFRLNFNISNKGLFRLSKILILNSIHRFQDQILEFGTSEQFHLDSFTSDILSLTRHMISKDFYQEFLLASFEIHKYWDMMCKNIRKTREAELSKCEAVLPLIMKIQFEHIRVICNSSLDMGTEEYKKSFEENLNLWKKEQNKNMVIREEHKIELQRLCELLVDKFSVDINRANEQVIQHLIHVSSVLDHFHPYSASYLVQVLIFVLKFKIEATSNLESNPNLYFHSAEILKTLIERFEINWNNLYETKSLFPSLCAVVWMPGITSRVKVSVIQTLTWCIKRFISPLTTHSKLDAHITVGEIDEEYLNKLGETIGIYLADREWEVRDSALELILQCMKVQSPYNSAFTNWFLKFHFLDHTFQAIGDIEPYVQATALEVLAVITSNNEIWKVIKPEDIKQKALRAIIRSGESPIQIAGFHLLHELAANSKFAAEEMEKFVIPVVQASSQDHNSEMRLVGIKFIQHHFDMELLNLGMVDGAFPKITFQCGKIVNLEDETVAQQIFSLVSKFCDNGYFRCLINCYKDTSKSVAESASSFINCIISLIEKYNLHEKISSHNKPDYITNISWSSYASSKCTESDTEVDMQKEQKLDEEGIEYVLNTSDLSVISSLKNESAFNIGQLWWNGNPSEHLLNENEIPSNFSSISGNDLHQMLVKIQTKPTSSQDFEINYEREIGQLLEDILLVTKNIDNDARARDCY